MLQPRLKVLMFAEAVTLAHVARPLALAARLAPDHADVTIACSARQSALLASPHWSTVDLTSIPAAQFGQALARGAPLYDLATLDAYVQQDLALIKAHAPDVVVGDFRLSLSVSARLAQVPYLAIASAYWSPFHRTRFVLPVLPISQALPLPLARALFSLAQPLAFAAHCVPMNRLRARHGLPSLGWDLRRVYTDCDHLLVPDLAEMFPLQGPSGAFSHTGPLLWSAPAPAAEVEAVLAADPRPLVYVSLGSSGPPQALALVLQALDDLPVRVVASTAGAPLPAQVPANATVAPFWPGEQLTAAARLVVCNGGSLTVQQALACGVPVLGLASNMDQFLNMGPVVQSQAGRLLRCDRLQTGEIRQAAAELMASATTAQAVQGWQRVMAAQPDAAQVFMAAARRLVAR